MKYYNRERLRALIINTIDCLEQVDRVRELTNIIWDVKIESNKTDRDWKRVEILLESYEKARDEPLEAAISNLRELVLIMNSLI